MFVRSQNLECLSDLLLIGTTTDIKEVSRRSLVQLDDVHGSHGKTSTVDFKKYK